MKFQVLQKDLARSVAIASRFTSPRAQLPILGNLLFSAKKNKLQIMSTNLETSIATTVGAQVDTDGSVAIPSRVISDLVSNLPTGQVSIDVSKEKMNLSIGGFSSMIAGMQSSDFPSIPQSVGVNPVKIPAQALLGALSQVLYSSSSDESRPVLTGVLLVFGKRNLTLVATDGFRLSRKIIKSHQRVNFQQIILPKVALFEISKLATDIEHVEMSFSEDDSQVVFGLGDLVLTSRVIQGDFPDYEKIIPQKPAITANFDKEDFARAIKTSSVFARDSANTINIKLTGNTVLVSSISKQSGKQDVEFESKIEGLSEGKEFSISFNYRFIEDFLSSVKSDDVLVRFSGSNAPALFTDTKDEDFLHLIMPVKV